MQLEKAYYEQKFEIAFLRTKGNEFQTFFERLMGLAYPGDFMACRPWGKTGDKKNDGFLKSEKRLFQVYAPNEMTAKNAIKKIEEDFSGALKHWGSYFNLWTFVHNSAGGLPPHVHQCILSFESSNQGIVLDQWGLEELRKVFRLIDTNDLHSWFGFAPTEQTKLKLGFSDLQPVLENLAIGYNPVDAEVHDVPINKIEANGLSEATASLIKAGMGKSVLVERFLAQWHEETLGDKIAEAFRARYLSLKEHFGPNEIFSELQAWAGGPSVGTPERQLAVLTVLAYYFERCDIFEKPQDPQK